MTTNANRENSEYPTCHQCGSAHGYKDAHTRPSQCPVCPSASPPATLEDRWECLACGWYFYFDARDHA